jgi:hypothetical protein
MYDHVLCARAACAVFVMARLQMTDLSCYKTMLARGKIPPACQEAGTCNAEQLITVS